MATSAGAGETHSHGLVRAMGLWDVILFNIAAVLGPRWVAAAAHSGPSSLGLWVAAALLFFLPSALVITELATRFPQVGGIYAWTHEAFGPFHGFVSGWAYWTFTIVYFPALLNASVAMSVYMGGPRWAFLSLDKGFVMAGSLVILALAIGLNIVGVGIGKWLENAGALGTYIPLALVVIFGAWFATRFGAATHFGVSNLAIHVDWGTINYWSQIAFAFAGLEVVCFMSEEIHEPRRTLPLGIFGAALAVLVMYILGTMGTLAVLHPGQVDIRAGAIQALTSASGQFGLAWIAILMAVLLAIGNVGGVGTSVAGVARIPFAAGIDRYLPRAFGKIHPTWRTPWVAMLVQGAAAAVLLVVSQIGGSSATSAYQVLVDATTIMYFIAFLYMFLAFIALGRRPDRRRIRGQAEAACTRQEQSGRPLPPIDVRSPGDQREPVQVKAAVPPTAPFIVPLGQFGVWACGLLGFAVTLLAMAVALIPPSDLQGSRVVFEIKLVGICTVLLVSGLVLYWRRGLRAAPPR